MTDPLKRFAAAALADETTPGGGADTCVRHCEWEGCMAEGVHPAPKSRSRLGERYWFCKEHAREYNRAWNYFAGMSADQIERERRRDTIWQRPTWPFGRADNLGQEAKQQAAQAGESAAAAPAAPGHRPQTAAECRAVSTLGLATPYTEASLKACYRSQAKAAHPDLNPDDPRAEERFKELREAYMTLSRAIST